VVLKLIALVLPLGVDSFLVAASLGVAGVSQAERRRIPFLFATFEGAMPLVGVLLGYPLGHVIGADADYLAAGLVALFGLYTLVAREEEEAAEVEALASARGLAMIALGISISLDELAIGFSLGLLRIPLLVVCPVLAIQAFTVSLLGVRLGASVSGRFRERAERAAGLALIAVGATIAAARIAG
jgi:manganese efflux pump family protein